MRLLNLPPEMRYIAGLSMLAHAEHFTLQISRLHVQVWHGTEHS